MKKEDVKSPVSYEQAQLKLVDDMILNVYKDSKGKVVVGYSKDNLMDEYMVVITKWKMDIVKKYLRFDEFLHYICDFCDIYFLLRRK